MIKIEALKEDIYSVEITSPREETDETDFTLFLNKAITFKKFALILRVEGEKAFSSEGKKKLGIWFKSNKSVLGEKCSGFVRINSKTTKVETSGAKAMRLAMPCPYVELPTYNEALSWIDKN